MQAARFFSRVAVMQSRASFAPTGVGSGIEHKKSTPQGAFLWLLA
jgi:hypothetical protein